MICSLRSQVKSVLDLAGEVAATRSLMPCGPPLAPSAIFKYAPTRRTRGVGIGRAT